MIANRTTFAASALLALIFVSSGETSSGATQNTNTFYRCESGWTFEANSNAARCKRGGGVVTLALMPCPQYTLPTGQKVGTARRQDYEQRKDMCVTTIPGAAIVAIENGCPLGSDKVIRTGLDHCARPNPLEIKAPSVSVQQP